MYVPSGVGWRGPGALEGGCAFDGGTAWETGRADGGDERGRGERGAGSEGGGRGAPAGRMDCAGVRGRALELAEDDGEPGGIVTLGAIGARALGSAESRVGGVVGSSGAPVVPAGKLGLGGLRPRGGRGGGTRFMGGRS